MEQFDQYYVKSSDNNCAKLGECPLVVSSCQGPISLHRRLSMQHSLFLALMPFICLPLSLLSCCGVTVFFLAVRCLTIFSRWVLPAYDSKIVYMRTNADTYTLEIPVSVGLIGPTCYHIIQHFWKKKKSKPPQWHLKKSQRALCYLMLWCICPCAQEETLLWVSHWSRKFHKCTTPGAESEKKKSKCLC